MPEPSTLLPASKWYRSHQSVLVGNVTISTRAAHDAAFDFGNVPAGVLGLRPITSDAAHITCDGFKSAAPESMSGFAPWHRRNTDTGNERGGHPRHAAGKFVVFAMFYSLRVDRAW